MKTGNKRPTSKELLNMLQDADPAATARLFLKQIGMNKATVEQIVSQIPKGRPRHLEAVK